MVKGMHTISQCQLINRINPEKHITETNDGIILMLLIQTFDFQWQEGRQELFYFLLEVIHHPCIHTIKEFATH